MTAQHHGLVSVIMPAYNASRYIRESIASVLGQTYTDWELLIINDGSTDDTGMIIKSFTDPRIRYFEKENGGVSSARNVGLKEMKGEYFCFLDSDDLLPDNSLEIRAAYLKEHPETDLLDGWVMVMDKDMKVLQRVYGPYYSGKAAKYFIRLSDQHFFGPNMMIRNNGMAFSFDERMKHVEDLWFYTQISWNYNLHYESVNDIIYHYRNRPFSAMSNLEGLETGYWQFYENVGRLAGITKPQLQYLKKRIVRIMVLSFLRRKKLMRAARTIKRLFTVYGYGIFCFQDYTCLVADLWPI